MSQVLIDIALGPEPKRIIQACAEQDWRAAAEVQDGERRDGSAGERTAVRLVRQMAWALAAGAMADPVVQRMQEKFGAEIRTVIDQKDRG